jgi:hypothetical protein
MAVAGRTQQTKLDIVLDAKDSGAFLARYGYADGLKGAPRASTASSRGPARRTSSTSTRSTGVSESGRPGRFTKLEPGPGKLLACCRCRRSRDASPRLQRRVQRGFRVRRHHAATCDRERRHVDVGLEARRSRRQGRHLGRDRPRARKRSASRARAAALSSSVSAGGALFFLANPLVGAAVGAGSLFAQTLLQDPVEKIFRYDYTVTGSWSDPVVAKAAARERCAATAALPKSTSDR